MRLLYLADIKDVHTERWARYFAEKGHEVHIASFKRPKNLDMYANIHIHHLKSGFLPNDHWMNKLVVRILDALGLGHTTFNPVFIFRQLKELLNEIKPDILHGHSIIHHTIIGCFTNFHPYVVSAWGNDVLIYPTKSKIVKYFVKHVLAKADIITSDGENSKLAMINLGADRDKIEIIYHGVDTEEFSPSKKNHKLFPDLFGGDNFPTVVSARSLSSMYDVETLIKAVPIVLQRIPECKFLIAGKGPQMSYLEHLTVSLNVQDNVRFVGWIPHNQLASYLASADVYVSTSLWDGGMGVATVDALACGTAPVVTDVADHRLWIEDGKNGLLFSKKDYHTLAQKIIYLLENEEIRIGFGRINRRLMQEKQEYHKNMKRMEEIYYELYTRSRRNNTTKVEQR